MFLMDVSEREFFTDLLKDGYDQEQDLNRLLKRLNAGGKRNWIVIARPDKRERNKKSPDYICEEVKTKKRITIEVTRAFANPTGAKNVRGRKKLLLTAVQISEKMQKQLRYPGKGIYVAVDELCKDPRDDKGIDGVAAKFVEEYGNGKLESFKKIVGAGFLLVHPSCEIEDLWDQEDLGNYETLEGQIKLALIEANNKLTNCDGEGIVLLTIYPLIDREEIEILRSIERLAFPNIKRFYALCATFHQLYKIFASIQNAKKTV
jgi:hypothetical protein